MKQVGPTLLALPGGAQTLLNLVRQGCQGTAVCVTHWLLLLPFLFFVCDANRTIFPLTAPIRQEAFLFTSPPPRAAIHWLPLFHQPD